MAERGNAVRVTGALAVVGGVLVVLGALLTWVEVPQGPIGFEGGRVDDSAAGVDMAYGVVALVAGVVAVLGALAYLSGRVARPASLVVLLAGAVALGVVVLCASSLDARFVDANAAEAASPEFPRDKAERLLDGLLANGTISTRAAPGLFVAGAGAALALLAGAIGSLVGGVRRRSLSGRPGPAPPAADTPSESTGP